jgi:hypothetical protein
MLAELSMFAEQKTSELPAAGSKATSSVTLMASKRRAMRGQGVGGGTRGHAGHLGANTGISGQLLRLCPHRESWVVLLPATSLQVCQSFFSSASRHGCTRDAPSA